MFGPQIQQWARALAERIVRPLAALGITPNIATVIGLVLNVITATIFASGHLRLGAVAMIVAGLFDMVDGALARVRNQKTNFGAFFDSTLDRLSEGIVLLGIIIFAVRDTSLPLRDWIIPTAYAAALCSVMVSYTRARAEGLGVELKEGLVARPERVVVLAGGLLIGGEAWLLGTLMVLAAATLVTTVQRIVMVWRKLDIREAAPEGQRVVIGQRLLGMRQRTAKHETEFSLFPSMWGRRSNKTSVPHPPRGAGR